jgi:hypothetical protein
LIRNRTRLSSSSGSGSEPNLIRIQIRLFLPKADPDPHKSDANLQHWPTDPLRLYCKPACLDCESPQLPSDHSDADPALNFDADPDP